jgi:hypothetical protein
MISSAALADNGFRASLGQLEYRFAGQSLSVPLSEAAVARGEATVRAFNANTLASVVERDVVPYLQQEYGALLSVSVMPTGNGYNLNWQGPLDIMSNALFDDVSNVANRAEATYYRERFMRQLQPGALYPSGVVVVDYPRLSHLFYDDMKGLAEAIQRALPSGSLRDQVSLLNEFLQRIPYRELSSRDPRDGYGMLPPTEVLRRNQGDCDSKALIFAAVMRHLAPEVPVAFVLVEGHAFVGVGFTGGDRRGGDLVVPGTDLIAVEPVGPGRLPIGQVGDESLAGLTSGRFYILSADADDTALAALPPRPARLIKTGWQGPVWTTQYYDAGANPVQVQANLDRSRLVATPVYAQEGWQEQWLNETRLLLNREIAGRLDTIDSIDLSGTANGWSWRVNPDAGAYQRKVDAYNRLVDQINGLSRLSNQRSSLMTQLDTMRSDIDQFRAVQAEEQQIAQSRARALIADARRRFEESRFLVQRDGYLMIDLGAAAASHAPALSNLAQQFRGTHPRAWLANALVMLQAQPVRPVADRVSDATLADRSLDHVFQQASSTPLEKATVLAALARARFPDLEVSIVEAGQSGFVMVGMPDQAGDRVFTIGQDAFVAVDPAGPVFMPVGRLRDYFDDVPVSDWRIWPVPG